MQRVIESFDRRSDAVKAFEALEAAGVAAERLGYLEAVDIGVPGQATATASVSFAGLAHANVLGIGTVGAAGLFEPLVLGPAAGGLIGHLIDGGIAELDAHVHAEALRRGCVLVSADVPEAHAEHVHALLQRAGAMAVDERRREYMDDGWDGFDAGRPPMSKDWRDERRARHEADSLSILSLPPVR